MTGPAARTRRTPRGFLTALGLTCVLMLLVAGGVADQGELFPLVVLGAAAAAVGLLYVIFPHGPQFALGTVSGLAMYACLYVVIGRAAFPEAEGWARPVAFLLPIAVFIAACWVRRRGLRAWAQAEHHLADLAHLPRFARWLLAVFSVGVLCLSFPISRLDPGSQTAALLAAMAAISAISALSVGDVVRLLVDIALIFQAVTRRLSRLAVPIAAYSLLWSLLVVIFGSLYRIADGFSARPLFHDGEGKALRIDFADALHFSVVTLSTVGYGDIQPADDGVRLLASIQMLLAQLLLLFGFVEIMRGSRAAGGDAWEEGRPRPRHGAPAEAAGPPPEGGETAARPGLRRAPAGD